MLNRQNAAQNKRRKKRHKSRYEHTHGEGGTTYPKVGVTEGINIDGVMRDGLESTTGVRGRGTGTRDGDEDETDVSADEPEDCCKAES